MLQKDEKEDLQFLIYVCIAIILAFWILCKVASRADAHDQWADGSKIPDWVKHSCCGPADAHHLTPDMVHDLGDSYHIEGMANDIQKTIGGKPNTQILPSQDGDYWVFYEDNPAHETYSGYSGKSYMEPFYESVYCFFVPMNF